MNYFDRPRAADSLSRPVENPKALSMLLLFRASKNWALQVHVAKDNSFLGDEFGEFYILMPVFKFVYVNACICIYLPYIQYF